MVDTSQINNNSGQNYQIDVETMFKHFVTGGKTPNDSDDNGVNIGIDDLRANLNISILGTSTSDLITSLNISSSSTAPPASTPNTTTPTISAQESRCHAFYRVLGLPVIASDNTFYNPGFDSMKGDRKITLEQKIIIAGKVDPKFEAISQARETWAENTAQIFASPNSVEAGVLSLTSGTQFVGIRKFAAPFLLNTAANWQDYTITDQQYQVPSSTLVGNNIASLAYDFQDAGGLSLGNDGTVDNATTYSIFFNHQHIIVPFMVDPRIDFSIWATESQTAVGISQRVAVPFVTSNTALTTSSTANAPRPLIEKIIRDVFAQSNQTSSAGDGVAAAVKTIQEFQSYQSNNFGNKTISTIFQNNIFQTTQVDALANFLQKIQSLMQVLVAAMHKVSEAQGKYYWLPIPSTSGPEAGCTIREVYLNQNTNTVLITPNDFDISFNQLQVLMSSLTTSVAQSTATPDRGSYNPPIAWPMTYDETSSDSNGSLSNNTQDKIDVIRNKELSDASESLQIIEMIMGEYSGLGLCDILAIRGALSVLSLPDLLGFLDADAFIRAQNALGFSASQAQSSITTSMTNFTQAVYEFYQLMDQVFLNYSNSSGQNS